MNGLDETTWNAALREAMAVADEERGSRQAFAEESQAGADNAAGWDAACEWIGTRIEALMRDATAGAKSGGQAQ